MVQFCACHFFMILMSIAVGCDQGCGIHGPLSRRSDGVGLVEGEGLWDGGFLHGILI